MPFYVYAACDEQLHSASPQIVAAIKRAGPVGVNGRRFSFNDKPMSGMVGRFAQFPGSAISVYLQPAAAELLIRSLWNSQAALFSVMQMCDKASMYGFDSFLDKRKQKYHYFDDREVILAAAAGGAGR